MEFAFYQATLALRTRKQISDQIKANKPIIVKFAFNRATLALRKLLPLNLNTYTYISTISLKTLPIFKFT